MHVGISFMGYRRGTVAFNILAILRGRDEGREGHRYLSQENWTLEAPPSHTHPAISREHGCTLCHVMHVMSPDAMSNRGMTKCWRSTVMLPPKPRLETSF